MDVGDPTVFSHTCPICEFTFCIYAILDNLAAAKDVWFIGDTVLHDTFFTLANMRREAKINKREPPYLYGQYNISAFHMAKSMISNVLTRFCNSFIEAMNKNRMPRMIVFLPDRDLFRKLCDDNRPRTSKMIGKCLSWFTRFIENTIDAKKEEMMNIRRGALTPGEPKLIWIKVIRRPTNDVNIELVRQKINYILEETLVSRIDCNILDPNEAIKHYHFDRSDMLTHEGRVALWSEINNQLKAFDYQNISLKPQSVVTNNRAEQQECHQAAAYAGNDRYYLPIPPEVSYYNKKNR